MCGEASTLTPKIYLFSLLFLLLPQYILSRMLATGNIITELTNKVFIIIHVQTFQAGIHGSVHQTDTGLQQACMS